MYSFRKDFGHLLKRLLRIAVSTVLKCGKEVIRTSHMRYRLSGQ